MSRLSKTPHLAKQAPLPTAHARPHAIWVGLLVFATVIVAYLPALSGGFIWDDFGHVTRADLRDFAGLGRIWFEFGATQQYYPVLHTAFWFEHRIWGDSAFAYHLLNVLLHATGACLFGRLLQRLALPGAWLAALLFALHPVCVESVAWISEQKNTLSIVLYLAAALAYLRFDLSRRPAHYAIASGLFFLALLTKTVTATLPAALLVVFWWQRGRLDWRREVQPLSLWFAFGVGAGLVTAHFESAFIGARGSDFDLTAVERFLLAGRVFWFYLGKLAWPAELIFIYPRWTVDAAELWQWLFPLGAVALLGALLVLAWKRGLRGPLAVLLLFGGTLFPVLGFVEVFPFLFSYVADHFQYHASLAIFALAGMGLAYVHARLPRRAAWAGGVALLLTLAALTWMQSRMYRDVLTLYRTTLAQNPACWMAHQNLALALTESGRTEEALAHLEAALRLKPDHAPAENNLGDNLLRLGRPAAALPHLERAVQLHAGYAVAHCNHGLALARLGRIGDARRAFAEAARLDPRYPEAEFNWGIALVEAKLASEALPHLARTIQLAPRWASARIYYGRVLASEGRLAEAADEFRAAVDLEPESGEAHLMLARALSSLGHSDEAQEHFRAARRLGANF